MRPALSLTLACLCLAALLCGCGQTPALVHQYVLEYSPPAAPGAGKVADAITVPRFSVAPDFNTTAMVYRPAPLQRATYQYSRWRVNPGAMTADYLARDLRHAGLFTAVFTSGESGQSRYMLEGGVTEIQEINGPDAWHAALGLSITLLDRNETEITRQVVFQKQYRAEELLTAKTPQGLAEAMSRALARLSGEILRDVGRTVKGRTP